MRTSLKTLWPLLWLPVLLAGCMSIRLTNLTPRQLPRNADGLYSFEVAWRSNQQALRKDSIQAAVILGEQVYPMEPVPLVKDRWETLVPVPAGERFVNYHYKFDFEYYGFPVVRSDSRRSQTYQLEIVER
jgi:hypothetical protein